MRKTRKRHWAALLSLIGIMTSQSALAQCENPVGLDELLAGIEAGYSIDPGLPQPAIVLASRGISVRGFIDVELPVVSQQCESDYFFVFEFIGQRNAATAAERLANLANLRARLQFDFFIDGQPVVLFDTEHRDGFHPVDGDPMAYTFTGVIIEPLSLAPGLHTEITDIFFEFVPGSGEFFFVGDFQNEFEILADDASASESIGSDGGTVATENGDVVVTIPAGALDADTSISVIGMGEDFVLTSSVGQALVIFGVDIGPEGTVFNLPITLVFAWDDADNDGKVDGTNIQENKLIITKDGVAITGQCQSEPLLCNTAANTFTFSVMSLSEFTLAGPLDTDNDGVADDFAGVNDVCPGTAIPEAAPTSTRLGKNRWTLDNSDGTFTQAPPQAGSVFSFTTANTRGCSCAQIVDEAGLGNAHLVKGCSTSAMLNWINNP